MKIKIYENKNYDNENIINEIEMKPHYENKISINFHLFSNVT